MSLGDWARLVGPETPYEALPAIVDRLVADALDDVREALAADRSLPAAARAALLTKAYPLLQARTRELVGQAWLQSQTGTRPN